MIRVRSLTDPLELVIGRWTAGRKARVQDDGMPLEKRRSCRARRAQEQLGPFGGGEVIALARRLAPLAMPSIYLFDRERSPESAVREQAASIVNRHPNCRAFVTQKRTG